MCAWDRAISGIQPAVAQSRSDFRVTLKNEAMSQSIASKDRGTAGMDSRHVLCNVLCYIIGCSISP